MEITREEIDAIKADLIEDTRIMNQAAAEIQRLRRENATLTVANNLLVKRNIALSERVQELGGYSD